ncbi:hypothetical protein [Streptomyces sp. NPDC015130]|uniref:hypothetical protein n=1 Tax=Streptomyces sp. NPDC015130 TaxID=3364940 RepID=UPI0036F76CF7
MTSIDLEIFTDDPTEQAALFAYWLLADDGETWLQTVAEIRAQLGLTQQQMTRVIREGAEARLPEISCPTCGEPAVATSRTNCVELRRLGNVLCAPCKAAAQAERAQQEAERTAARYRALAQTFQISAAADRARANGWEIKSFGRPWNLPMTAMDEVFFSKVLWQPDMMQTVAREATPPPHAWAAAPIAATDADVDPWSVPDRPYERPEDPSDEEINDCVECGTRIYRDTLCEPCKLL